ncbi:hypothetical protein EW146_g8757 [Bondarzewia mesenterica]|uniref:Telomerase reverse transcriptase n=1 Tax=Bondarzewia mesenterica TaxID=1095465 RepID=A0A4S4LH91_9AGAM|nr:hypothetical protein EW146_g8757 [Bondarzewia mesenterica]
MVAPSEELSPEVKAKIDIASQKKDTALRGYHESLLYLQGIDKSGLKTAFAPSAADAAAPQEKTVADIMIEKIYANMSACHIKLENWRRALETADKALAKNENNHKATFRKAKALGELGYFERAETLLEDLVKKSPSDAPAATTELARLRAMDKQRERVHNQKLKGRRVRHVFLVERPPVVELPGLSKQPTMTSTSKITLSILQSYYPIVKDLQTYLLEILEFPDSEAVGLGDFPLQKIDSEGFRRFVQGSYVALTRQDAVMPGRGMPRLKSVEPMVHMREIIDRVQEKLMMKSKAPNIVTAGYRSSHKKGDRGKPGMTRLGVSNYFVNTMVTALQGPEWERLLTRIGEDAMFYLLMETCMFIPLPNDCLCQITGEPIVFLRPPALKEVDEPLATGIGTSLNSPTTSKRKGDDLEEETGQKRVRSADTSASSTRVASRSTSLNGKPPIAKRKAADIPIARARLFYARPTYLTHTSRVVAGLPPKHILNILNPANSQGSKALSETYRPPDLRKQMQDARHLSKYIFPRMYGLSNVFSLPSPPRPSSKLPDYIDREDEIKSKGPCKTPERLKSVIDHLEKMVYRHGKCGYIALRDLTCPSKLKDDKQKPLDSSIILELMSEQSINLHSQRPIDSELVSDISLNRTTLPPSLTQSKPGTKAKPRFAEFACSILEVYRYVVLVTKAVIPKSLWGCDDNFKSVMKSVKEFIAYRRYETTTLHHIMQGVSISKCEWLALRSSMTEHRTSIPVSDSIKRRELMEEFLFWYFSSFLLTLLRTTFYITESGAFRNRTLYFRQDDWQTLCAPLIDRLSSDTFLKLEKTETEEILRQRKLGFSFVRLLPKDTGVRPIVNLKRKKIQQKGSFGAQQQSINDILQAAFQILTFEKDAQPHLLGSSVFGPNEIYGKLKAFKSRLAFNNPSGPLPKLYFVKVDVQACFDTIEQAKLLQILRDAISEESYMLPRFGRITRSAGKIKRKFVKKAVPGDEHPHFVRYACQLAGLLRHAIFVDQVVYPFSMKQEILELLEEHITENIVKVTADFYSGHELRIDLCSQIGQDYYRQIVGIPQGSVLSALLCSFFYGDLEREHLQFTHDQGSVLLRLIDDYLFITTDISKAKHFLDVMSQGHPQYGCFISREKTLTNFDYDPQIMNVTAPHQKSFPWCGFLINMTDLSVSGDYARYHDSYVVDSLTVDRGRRAGAAFVHKMLQLAKAKSHIIYCDTDLNSERVVYFNVYQNFLLVAMKMHHYLKCWGTNIGKNTKFIHSTIQQVIRYTYATVRNKASNKVAIANQGRSMIQKSSLMWYANVHFSTVSSSSDVH